MKLTKLTFSGDIMLNDIANSYRGENDKYDFHSIFEGMKDFLSQSDFVIGNLETPISEEQEELKEKQKYCFTSPIEFAKAIKEAGFDFVSTANNHCLDNGVEGIKETINCLDKVGLEHTGIFYKEGNVFIKNINNIKIAILAYTYGTNAFSNNIYLDKNDLNKVNMLQKQELSNNITKRLYQSKNIIFKIIRKLFKIINLFQLKKPIYERKERDSKQKKEIIKDIQKCKELGAEYIIICMHEGGQYNLEPIRKTLNSVRFMQKNDANLIVVNHEHVVHKITTNNNQIVSYCLGNFCSTTGIYEEPFDKMAEYSILLHVYLSKNEEKATVEKITFSILKIVEDKKKNNKGIKVKLLYDLISESNGQERENLMRDNQKVVYRVTGKKIEICDIEKEYQISTK